MCGFVGAWGLRAPFRTPAVEEAALARLAHRGPDGSAWHQDERSRIGFRRLAIIDVAGGGQPLASEDGRVVAMVNGEIYNHGALRSQLAHHRFGTRSDAEVVVHGYEEWGDRVFERLRGMFAVVVADRRNERLVLARDRVGKKPVYYRLEGDELRFASEIRALVHGEPPPVDRAALNDYLRFGYVPAPRTLFEGVRKLQAGHLLSVDEQGRVETRRWAPLSLSRPGAAGTMEEWGARVREALAQAVHARLESEVPLGFLLSGGLDSSAVLALGAQALGDGVRAFTIGFRDPDVDETHAARQVANRYRVRHAVHVLHESEAPSLIDVVARCEEPIATDALLPTDRVFAAVRAAGITTVLTGEGADEIFAGYQKFGHAAVAFGGPGGAWEASGATPLARYLSREEFSFPTLAERIALIGDAATDDGFEWLDEAVAGLDPMSQMLSIEVALRLPDRINHRLDRLSMAHSIEARAPFMDSALMELALQIPHALLSRRGAVKVVLRRAMAQDLPPTNLSARKAPFRAPDSWFVNREHGVDAREAAEAGLVAPDEVTRLRAAAANGDGAATERLYNLTVLHLWHRVYYRGGHDGEVHGHG